MISRDTDTLNGVDVVLRTVPSKKVCSRCVLASATILGVSDMHALHTEAGRHDFRFDFPEAQAGDAVASSEASLSIFATPGTQRDELVRSLFPFIAIPGDFQVYLAPFRNCGGSPRSACAAGRPSALREQSPFRDCGGITRREQQLDGCRGPRAALRRVEYSSRMAAAYGGAVAFRSFMWPLVLSSGFWVRRPDANDRQPLTTATTSIWCCTPSGMLI